MSFLNVDSSNISVKRKVQTDCQGSNNAESRSASAISNNFGGSMDAVSSPGPGTPTSFYGINIPCENLDQIVNTDFQLGLVYTDRSEALNALKQHKKARFKVFKTSEEALQFAFHTNLEIVSTVTETLETRFRPNSQASSLGEKPSLFKGPKAQELVKLRKSIECGDLITVRSMVWENPRYLVSSGDTPAILQEGSRYNALHVAAKAKNADITEFVLQTIGDPKFIGLLYGDDSLAQSKDRIHILLDLYLNTPDKGLNETPLHFAVKYGASKVVAILISSPQCEKQPKNKYGQTPREIVCSRVNSPDVNIKEEIFSLLDGHFYVPVLRSGDNSIQPTVGKPFSPVTTCLPELNDSPLDTRVEIRAYAGPMNQQQANVFHKMLKTPPRVKRATLNPWRLADSEKGLEREGRDLAQELKVGWKEYWAFLDSFVDFSSSEGLGVLENYLQKRFFPMRFNGAACNTDKVELLLKEESEISHVHDGTSDGPKSPVSPITDLCRSLQACTLSNKSPEYNPKCVRKNIVHCGGPSQKEDSNELIRQNEEALLGVLAKPGLSPFLCVDKSCQVFGKRIADGLTHIGLSELGNNGDSILDFLKQEMKHLQLLVCSYKDDARFVSVDFHLVHSRIASIVRAHLANLLCDEIDVLSDISSFFHEYQHTRVSSDEEDLNVNASTYRNQVTTDKKKKSDAEITRIQVSCVAYHIFSDFTTVAGSFQPKSGTENKVHYQTEEDCIKVWADAVKCCCPWPVQYFVRNSRKGSSYNRLKHLAHKGYPLGEIDVSHHTSIEVVTSKSKEHNEQAASNDTFNSNSDGEADSNSEEELFFSAPSSPLSSSDESSEDEMESPDEGESVFIDGSSPSQVDASVLQALDHKDISCSRYPNIYRWRHSLQLYLAKHRALVHYTSTPESRHRTRPCTSSLRDNVVPPCSPLSPQFNREIKKNF